jgi:SWI/SNF-related matrix-associated actin-dependent regulator of chromatin subfamily A3
VLTTYQTVVGDHSGGSKIVVEGSSKRKKTESTLLNIPWKRVIIDEGHQIRNPKTKVAVAVSALKAERRWVLTGTPIVCFSIPLSVQAQAHRFIVELSKRSWLTLDILEDLSPLGPAGLFQPAHSASIEVRRTRRSRLVTSVCARMRTDVRS